VRRAALATALVVALGAPARAPADAQAREPVESVEIGLIDAMPTGPSVDERLAEIRRRIQAAVRYPPLARRHGLEGVARVAFEIGQQDRRARGVELLASSGHPALDRAAERSVTDAGELPWVYGRLEVPVRFELKSP
jgi:TonB family protein